MKSRFALHVDEWKDCTKCELSRRRSKVVIARGKVPCDILLVGQSPGNSEDTVGIPFCGPAGQLLDHIVSRSIPESLRVAFTNMVCCLSKGEDTDDPPDDAVEACKPRLEQFIALAEPRLIVTVGKLAKGWLDPGYKNSVKMLPSTKLTFIDHPAFVLRSNISQKGLLVDRAISNIKMAVEEYFGEQM